MSRFVLAVIVFWAMIKLGTMKLLDAIPGQNVSYKASRALYIYQDLQLIVG